MRACVHILLRVILESLISIQNRCSQKSLEPLNCHNGRKSWMKSFNQVSLTGTLFQNTIALCIVVMDTEHEMMINFFFLWSINLFYFSELFDVLCKKRPHRRICLLRKVLMTRLNLFHFLFNQRSLLVSQLMTNKERAQL